MKLFIKFFGCGSVERRLSRCDYIVQDIKSISNKIVLHFDASPIKQLDYNCFK